MGIQRIRLVSDGDNLTVYADGVAVTTRRIRGAFDFEIDKKAAEMAAERDRVNGEDDCRDHPCA